MKTHEEQTAEALARAIEAIKSASPSDAAAQLEHGLVLGVATRHVIAYALGRGASRRDAYLFARDTLTACADEMARLAAELAPEGGAS